MKRPAIISAHGLISGLRLKLPALLLAVGLGLALVQTAHAATLDVCQPPGTCTYDTIQAAVNAATSGDTITIGAGTYVENVNVVNKSLIFQGAGSAATIVDGGAADRVFASNTALTLADMTVQNGRVNNNGGGIFASGALALTNVIVYNNTTAAMATIYTGGGAHTDSTLTLSNTQFISNTTGSNGGAAYATGVAIVSGGTFAQNRSINGGGLYANSTLTLTDTEFISNTVTERGGGAYANGTAVVTGARFEQNGSSQHGGGLYAQNTLTLSNTEFISNTITGTGYNGGGAYANGAATVLNGSFAGNRAGTGGGLYGYATLVVSSTQFISNTSTNTSSDGGGGLFAYSTADITGGSFEGNRSSFHGGGMYARLAVVVQGAQFISNTTSGLGGGIYAASSVELSSTRFAGNTAAGDGGGLALMGSAPVSMVNMLLERNSAGGNGAALYKSGSNVLSVLFTTVASPTVGSGTAFAINQGTLRITDTLFANYTQSITNTTGSTVYSDYNLFFNAPATVITGSHSITDTDPLFVAVAEDNYRLLAGSPASSAGIAASIDVDLDGATRRNPPSIGAYEGPPQPSVHLSKQAIPAGITPNHGVITYTLLLSNTGQSTDTSVFLTDTLPATMDFGAWLENPGGTVVNDVIAWNGALAHSSVLTFAFTTIHVGAYADLVVNTAEFSATIQSGTASVTSTIQTCASPIAVQDLSDSGPGTLRQALIDVCAGGTIDFDLTYPSTVTLASGQALTLTKDVTIAGPGADLLAVSGNSNTRVFMVNGGVNATIDGLTVRDGRSTSAGGGGIYNAGTLTITNGAVTNNFAVPGGGGIHNVGILNVISSTFASNTSIIGVGGIHNAGTLTVISSTLTGNTSASGAGGIYSSGVLTMSSSTVASNQGISSGGIYNTGTFVMSGSTLFNNSGNSSSGGIFNSNTASLVVISSTVASNRSNTSNGGGISSAGDLTLVNSTIADNFATSVGGGIYNSGVLTATSSVFVNNRAPSVGGGVQNLGRATIENSSFFSNTASVDGSIRNEQALTLTNSTIAGAAGGVGLNNNGTLYMRNSLIAISTGSADCASSGTIAVNTNNLVADGSCSASLSRDPLLGDLGDYDGDTQTLPLLPGSPAIDAGDAGSCLTTDQRGIGRVGTCDIGAFESRGFTLAKGSGDNQSAFVGTTFANPISVTVASSYGEPVNGGVLAFAGPDSGAGIIPVTATITIADASAAINSAANSIGGSYAVTANALGATQPVTFSLTNTPPYLYVVKAGSGTGSVASIPAGIACGATCTSSYDYGTVVTLTASADSNAVFSGWSGSCSGSGDCTLTMTADVTATAAFAICPVGVAYVDKNAGGAGTGLSWADAYTDLQDALGLYQACGSYSEIWVATGVYTPGTAVTDTFSVPPGVGIYGGFAATETQRTQRDWVANPTILSGDIGGDDATAGDIITHTDGIVGANARTVVTLDGTNGTPITGTTRLDGFTVTGGSGGTSDGYGGGLYCNGAGAGSECSPTIANVTFSGNLASQYGGGIYADGEEGNSSPNLTNVILRGNSAGSWGGGMYHHSAGSPSLVNVTFDHNSAADNGGALVNDNNDNPSLVNVSFSRNTAQVGGGIFNTGDTINLSLANVVLWDNVATSMMGSQILNANATMTISHTLVPSTTTDIAEFGGSIIWGPGNITDTGAFTTTDIFVDADNGNLHLALGSPAIDVGDNGALPAGVTTDLDGNPRIVNGTVDLGAYESQMLPPLLTVAKFASPASTVAYRGIVTYTLVLGNTGGGDPAVLLTDTLPVEAGFAYWITQSGAVFAGNTVQWSGALNGGAVITVTFAVTNTASGGATITNTAYLSGSVDIVDSTAMYTATMNSYPSGSGSWSEAFAPCATPCKRVIPAGFTVTLDQDISLDGDFEIEPGGTFIANGKTVTLTGDQAQTLTGNPLTFYNLVINKTNKSDTVTIDGKLKVTKKLAVKRGRLISASDYEDVEIDESGAMALTSEITIGGNLIITGTLEANGHAIGFDGAKTQILSVDGFTNFDDLTVYTGTVLVETNPNSTVILNGKLTNHGTIRKTQPVDGLELYYFGLAGAYPNSAGMRIEVTERSGGDPLTAIQVDRVDANHPHAPAGAVTDVYWTITPAGTNYVATIVLPQRGLGNPTVCRYAGSSWDCDRTSIDSTNMTVSRAGVTTFSDWAVFEITPAARNDAAGTLQGEAVKIDPLANDIDPAGGGLIVSAVTQPASGSVVIDGDSKTVTFTPDPAVTGIVTFTYTARDIYGIIDEALVAVVVTAKSETGEAPQVGVVDNDSGSTLDFDSGAFQVQVQLPAGSYPYPLADRDIFYLAYTNVITPTGDPTQPPGNFSFAGIIFDLSAFLNGLDLGHFEFVQPVTLVIDYDPALVGDLSEQLLTPYYWNGTTWVNDGISITHIDTTAHEMTIQIWHLSEFALFSKPPLNTPSYIFLPAVANGSDLVTAQEAAGAAPQATPEAVETPAVEPTSPAPDDATEAPDEATVAPEATDTPQAVDTPAADEATAIPDEATAAPEATDALADPVVDEAPPVPDGEPATEEAEAPEPPQLHLPLIVR